MAFPRPFVLPQHPLPAPLHAGKEGCQWPLPRRVLVWDEVACSRSSNARSSAACCFCFGWFVGF